MPDYISPWVRLNPPVNRLYDECGHHISDIRYCAYNWDELTKNIGINFNEFYHA